jgi:hypothetical protein
MACKWLATTTSNYYLPAHDVPASSAACQQINHIGGQRATAMGKQQNNKQQEKAQSYSDRYLDLCIRCNCYPSADTAKRSAHTKRHIP